MKQLLFFSFMLSALLAGSSDLRAESLYQHLTAPAHRGNSDCVQSQDCPDT